MRSKDIACSPNRRHAPRSIPFSTARCERLESRRLLTNYSVKTIASLDDTNGYYATSTLAMDANGNLFGTTASGAANTVGAIFEFPAGQSAATTLYSFTSAGKQSTYGNVLIDKDGNLYAPTTNGGSMGAGSIIEVDASGIESQFKAIVIPGAQGQFIYGNLVISSPDHVANGQGVGFDLYGMTSAGGMNGKGTVFEIVDDGSGPVYKILAPFPADIGNLGSSLVVDGGGNVYGTTIDGGANGDGAIFEVPAGGSFALLASMDAATATPSGALLYDANAHTIYGTAQLGGPSHLGEIFKFVNGVVTPLAAFDSTNGSQPEGALYEDAQGDLFGVAPFGGINMLGTIFELPAGGNTITKLFEFDPNNNGGQVPVGGLVADSKGNLFGVTESGGDHTDGQIYELSPLPATQMQFVTQPSPELTNQAIAPPVTVKLLDMNGDLANFDNSNVTVALTGSPTGVTLGGTLTAPVVNGIATFSNLTVDTAGQYTLTATDGSIPIATSTQFTITAPVVVTPVPHVAFAQQPTSGIAGAKLSPLVVINLLGADDTLQTTTKPMKVFITTTDPDGKAFHLTAVAKKGVATLKKISFKVAGSYTLQAAASTFAQADSNAITMLPAAPKKMLLTTPPVATTHDIPFTVQTELVDRFANLATNDDSTVTASLIGGKGVTLGGTLTATVIDGLATFFDLSIDTPGKAYAIKLTDMKLHLNSKKFTVS